MSFWTSITDRIEAINGTTVIRGKDIETGEEHTVLRIRDTVIDGETVRNIQVVKDTRNAFRCDKED